MSDIATKLITVANNTPAVAEAVKAAQTTVSGAAVAVDDVLDMEHTLQVQLHSDTMEDFSSVSVTRYGKNLIDLVGLLGEDYTNEENGLQVHLEDGYAVIQGTHTYSGYTNILESDDLAKKGIVLQPGIYACPRKLSLQLRTLDTQTNRNCSGSFTLEEPRLLRIFYIFFDKVGTVVDERIPLTVVSGSEIPTEYIPYIDPQTATADESGKVNGLVSKSPSMTLITDAEDVTVECTYFPQSAEDTHAKYQALNQEQTTLQEYLQEILQEE